jgi:hypothetical protein
MAGLSSSKSQIENCLDNPGAKLEAEPETVRLFTIDGPVRVDRQALRNSQKIPQGMHCGLDILSETPYEPVETGIIRIGLMTLFPCPYLAGEVELTDERERHIAENHPDLLPEHRELIADVLAAPDQIRRSERFGNALLFSRWYDTLLGGKHIVVVVVNEAGPVSRHWIVTAYFARKLAEGEVEWKRS